MSNNIPTFAEYMAGKIITKIQESSILAADSEDRIKSITKLTELRTNIEKKIVELDNICSPHNKTASKPHKDNCSLEIDKHNTNNQQYQTILTRLLRKEGGKRQTCRHSKHNKNRKQNLRSRRHRNSRKLKSRKFNR